MNEDKLSQLERLSNLFKDGLLSAVEFEEQKKALLARNSPQPEPEILKKEIIQGPSSEPTPKNKPRKREWGNWVVFAVGVLVFLAIIDQCSENQNSIQGSSFVDTTTISSPAVDSVASIPPAPATRWTYYDDSDKMGSKYFIASIDANDLLIFDFPYNGGSTATLTVRKQHGETDVYLKVSKGQFITSVTDGGSARIKFDNASPVTYSTSSAADYSSDIVFFNNETKLIAKMKKAKKMVLEVQFYNEGVRQMEFDVAGLKWIH